MEDKKYDIFVSYSRKDIDVVDKLVGDIHAKTNARCWVDWSGIESGERFTDVIINAIENVDIVLFIMSDNSMSSDYVRMEIDYARNIGKKIIPVVVDGGKLRGWFLFYFGSIDYTDVKSTLQYDKLICNIEKRYVNKSVKLKDDKIPKRKEQLYKNKPFWFCLVCLLFFSLFITKLVDQKNDKQLSTSYAVGDYYIDGTKEGIVFAVYEGGIHGKIISLCEGKAQWAVDSVWTKQTNAVFDDGGVSNMDIIKACPNWKTDYPAFMWCSSLGDAWYLPAIKELELIYANKDVINRGLNDRGYSGLGEDVYWSSTEHREDISAAWRVKMSDGTTYYRRKKLSNTNIRAVATF